MNDILSSEDKSQINNLIEIDLSKNEDNENSKVMLFDDKSISNSSSTSNLFSETDVESSVESSSNSNFLTVNLNNENINDENINDENVNNIKFKKLKNFKKVLIKFYNYLKNFCKKNKN